MTLDEGLEKLEEISTGKNKGENELLDKNIPIAKTSKEVTSYIFTYFRKMVILLTRIQGMKQMFDCPIFQESSFCQKH